MRFKINLATRTYVNAGQLKAAIVAAVALLVLLLLINIQRLAANAGETKRLQNELGVSKGGRVVTDQEYQGILARIKFANGVIEKKTFDWLALLDKLEIVVPDGISLTKIEPDIRENGLKVSGVARNFNNLRHFMENLEGSATFTNVYLLGQGLPGNGENSKGITFNIACQVDFKKL
jgi:type IV pilus assembly protein PilN